MSKASWQTTTQEVPSPRSQSHRRFCINLGQSRRKNAWQNQPVHLRDQKPDGHGTPNRARRLRGVKLQPNFQQFSPDDRAMWPVYEAAQGRLVVLFHSGQEILAFEHVHAQPAAVARVHAAFPGLQMVVAHMGGYQMWDGVREHLVGKDLFLDTSYCPEKDIGDDDLRALIRDHGAERVVFATDFPWAHPGPDIERLCTLGLRQEEVEGIAWENAARLLGLELV